MKKTHLKIKGTHCIACKTLIEEVCSEMSGIKSCKVDFRTGEAIIEHDEKMDMAGLKKEIESLGEYKVM